MARAGVHDCKAAGNRKCVVGVVAILGLGPSYSLTHPVAGKTITRIIPAGDAVDRTMQQLQEYQRFRALVHQLTAVSEQICDLELRQPSADDYKKNSARRPSRG